MQLRMHCLCNFGFNEGKKRNSDALAVRNDSVMIEDDESVVNMESFIQVLKYRPINIYLLVLFIC